MLRYLLISGCSRAGHFFLFLDGGSTHHLRDIAGAGYTSGGGGEIILKMSDVIFCESVQTHLFVVIACAVSKTKFKFKGEVS